MTWTRLGVCVSSALFPWQPVGPNIPFSACVYVSCPSVSKIECSNRPSTHSLTHSLGFESQKCQRGPISLFFFFSRSSHGVAAPLFLSVWLFFFHLFSARHFLSFFLSFFVCFCLVVSVGRSVGRVDVFDICNLSRKWRQGHANKQIFSFAVSRFSLWEVIRLKITLTRLWNMIFLRSS